jgi:hypothetical protein
MEVCNPVTVLSRLHRSIHVATSRVETAGQPAEGRIHEVQRMRDLTEKQFVAAMVRNGFTKDGRR